jgi:hypothetical protein
MVSIFLSENGCLCDCSSGRGRRVPTVAMGNGKKKAGLFDLRTYEEVLRGMNLEEPIIFYRHDMGLLNPLLS